MVWLYRIVKIALETFLSLIIFKFYVVYTICYILEKPLNNRNFKKCWISSSGTLDLIIFCLCGTVKQDRACSFLAWSTCHQEHWKKFIICSLLYLGWLIRESITCFPNESLSLYISICTWRSSRMVSVFPSSVLACRTFSMNSSDWPGAIDSANRLSKFSLHATQFLSQLLLCTFT